MINIHYPPNIQKPYTPPLRNIEIVFSRLLPVVWEHWYLWGTLRKLGNGQVLTRIVCEAGPSQPAALKLFWISQENLKEDLLERNFNHGKDAKRAKKTRGKSGK